MRLPCVFPAAAAAPQGECLSPLTGWGWQLLRSCFFGRPPALVGVQLFWALAKMGYEGDRLAPLVDLLEQLMPANSTCGGSPLSGANTQVRG